MTGHTEQSEHFHVVLAQPNWTATDIIVADAFLSAGTVKIEPRDRMCVEDEEGLKDAIRQGKSRFQAEGFSMHDACQGLPPRPGDEKTRLNAWSYLIVPVREKAETSGQPGGAW